MSSDRFPHDPESNDRELLRRFTAQDDQGAFALLVSRYGPLVMGACRRHIGHEQEAEDACQAVFLVLARKAGVIAWHDSVGGWLHEVACRLAAEKRSRLSWRRARETEPAFEIECQTPPEPDWMDRYATLERELARLPDKYRVPLSLCYLEGQSRDQAARRLGVTRGRVKGLLERGRQLLRRRLANSSYR